MKRLTQKRINECLKDIPANFKELIDAIIWYEKKDMDDWSDDIIGYIERKQRKERIQYLFDDLPNRGDGLTNPKYQGIWYGLFNVDQNEENTHEEIVSQLKKHINKELALNFIKSQDQDEGGETEINIRKILSQYNDKPKP